jgi:hypothetical protein
MENGEWRVENALIAIFNFQFSIFNSKTPSSPPDPLSRRRGGVVPMAQAVEQGKFLPLTLEKSFAPLLPSPSGDGAGVRTKTVNSEQ